MANYIIVEGPDGAGKTTFINQLLISHPRALYQHFGAPANEEEADNHWRVYAKFIKGAEHEHTVILDRAWYSDQVYGPVMRGRFELDHSKQTALELLIKACGGGVIIYLTAPTPVLWKRCIERGETYIPDEDTLDKIKVRYEEVMKRPLYLPVLRMDTGVEW